MYIFIKSQVCESKGKTIFQLFLLLLLISPNTQGGNKKEGRLSTIFSRTDFILIQRIKVKRSCKDMIELGLGCRVLPFLLLFKETSENNKQKEERKSKLLVEKAMKSNFSFFKYNRNCSLLFSNPKYYIQSHCLYVRWAALHLPWPIDTVWSCNISCNFLFILYSYWCIGWSTYILYIIYVSIYRLLMSWLITAYIIQNLPLIPAEIKITFVKPDFPIQMV